MSRKNESLNIPISKLNQCEVCNSEHVVLVGSRFSLKEGSLARLKCLNCGTRWAVKHSSEGTATLRFWHEEESSVVKNLGANIIDNQPDLLLETEWEIYQQMGRRLSAMGGLEEGESCEEEINSDEAAQSVARNNYINVISGKPPWFPIKMAPYCMFCHGNNMALIGARFNYAEGPYVRVKCLDCNVNSMLWFNQNDGTWHGGN